MYYGTYTFLTELILVLQSLFVYFGSCTELILVLRILYEAYSCISDLIRSLFLYKSTRRYYTNSLYGGTRRYYINLSDTEVPVGTTEILLVQKYP